MAAPIVISFHADQPGQDFFARRAARLAGDCARGGIEQRIRRLDALDCWSKTTCLKPAFILESVLELKRPVLWVDADSRILGPIAELADLEARADIAAVAEQLGRRDLPVMGTVLWFNYTPAAIEFLTQWAAAATSPDNFEPDHDVFCRLWRRQAPPPRKQVLPACWCRMGRLGPRDRIAFEVSRLPARKHVRRLPEITAVITTCRRPELYHQTMDAFRRCCVDADQVNRWLVIDDGSPLAQRQAMAARWPRPEILFHRRGHHGAINLAYELIRTPLTFWLEDDWRFIRGGNIVHEAFSILTHEPRLAQVGFVHWPCPPARTGSGVDYRIHRTLAGQRIGSDQHWPGFTLNPNLHWTERVRKCLPAAPPQFEHAIAKRLAAAGWLVAHAGRSWCRHVGRLSAYTLSGNPK